MIQNVPMVDPLLKENPTPVVVSPPIFQHFLLKLEAQFSVCVWPKKECSHNRILVKTSFHLF